MSHSLINLKRKVINVIPEMWYHLDDDTYVLEAPHDAIWRDNQHRVCSRYQDSFYRFYLVNGIDLIPPVCTTTDVQQVPIDDLYRLTNFSLEGLFTKVRILNVLDGHRLEVAFFVPHEFLSKYQPSKQNYGIARRAIPYHGDIGFFMRERCILKNLTLPSSEDIPLPDKEIKAQLGLELLSAWCNSMGNIAYVEFCREGNSRDRPILMYNDMYQSISINHELLAHKHPQVREIYRENSSPPESFLYGEQIDFITDLVKSHPLNV